jgi:hypothetical protein
MVFFVTLPLSFGCLIGLVLHMALALEASSIIAAARGAFFMTFGILRMDLGLPYIDRVTFFTLRILLHFLIFFSIKRN